MYFKKLNVPDYGIIQNELQSTVAEKIKKNLRYWDEPYIWFQKNSPTLYQFIEARKKISVRLCRFYLTPPNDILIPHVDGLSDSRSPIGLNFPIIGYENTFMNWYESPEDNLKNGPYGFNGITASRVIDFSKLKHVDSVVIDRPTFVRTDVVHGVVNNNPTSRLVLSLRFYYSKTYGQNFEDVMNISDILLNGV